MRIHEYYKENPYIHYSNCHEDMDFVLPFIDNHPQKILTIASGLDNALAMLLLQPETVTAIDSNAAQIALCRLKKRAIEQLSYEEFLVFLGIRDGDCGSLYDRLRPYLDEATKGYFDSHRYLITDVKLIHCGRFEYYFSLFSRKVMPLIHSRKTVDAFMNAEDLEKQRQFYRDSFCNTRFKLLFRLFFSEAVMKRTGRDSAYFRYLEGSLSVFLRSKFETCIHENLNRDNPYLQYILYREFKTLPCYLRRENYEIIRQNIHRLHIRQADFRDVITQENGWDFLYLSDIFEYMDNGVMEEMSRFIHNALAPGGMALFFNMMNPRRLSQPLRETCLDQTHNRTFYYSNCYLYRKDYDQHLCENLSGTE